jgi:hypothetical protein
LCNFSEAEGFADKSGKEGISTMGGLSQNAEKRARQLANLKPFEKGHAPTPGGGRPKGITNLYMELMDQKVPGDAQGRLYAELFVEAGLKRAISRSDVLYKEIYDRLEGKAPQELRFAGYAEPYSEERMIETRSEIHRKLMDFLARGDPQEDSAQSEPVKALPERT